MHGDVQTRRERESKKDNNTIAHRGHALTNVAHRNPLKCYAFVRVAHSTAMLHYWWRIVRFTFGAGYP
jgi:hypothetical protein